MNIASDKLCRQALKILTARREILKAKASKSQRAYDLTRFQHNEVRIKALWHVIGKRKVYRPLITIHQEHF